MAYEVYSRLPEKEAEINSMRGVKWPLSHWKFLRHAENADEGAKYGGNRMCMATTEAEVIALAAARVSRAPDYSYIPERGSTQEYESSRSGNIDAYIVRRVCHEVGSPENVTWMELSHRNHRDNSFMACADQLIGDMMLEDWATGDEM